jgi:ankyrin repeat protein
MVFRRLFGPKGPKEFKTKGGATVVIIGRDERNPKELVKVKVVDNPYGTLIPKEQGGIGAILSLRKYMITASDDEIERELKKAVKKLPDKPDEINAKHEDSKKSVPQTLTLEELNKAFLKACKCGDLDKANLLLEKGADVNARDGFGTALSQAIGSGSKRLPMVAFLMDKGADANMKYKPLGSTKVALNDAVYVGDAELVRILIEKGADVNFRDEKGWGSLMFAVGYGHIDIVNCLLEAGADVNDKDKDGSTALITAAYNGRTEIVRVLLNKGADINIKSKDDMTAMMYAAKQGHSDIVKLLKDVSDRR